MKSGSNYLRDRKDYSAICVAFAVGGETAVLAYVDSVGRNVKCPACKGQAYVMHAVGKKGMGSVSFPCKLCIDGKVRPTRNRLKTE